MRTTRFAAASTWALAALLALPLGSVAAAGETNHFLGATLSLRRDLRAGDGTELRPDCATPLVSSYSHFSTDPWGQWFEFQEAQGENGCGEYRIAVDVPAGATKASIKFQSDRIVTQAQDTQLPVNMAQQLRVYDGNGTLIQTFEIFERTSGSAKDLKPFAWEFGLPPGRLGRLQFGWFFQDIGPTVASKQVPDAIVGESLTARVRLPVAGFSGIPISPSAIDVTRLGSERDLAREATSIVLGLDPATAAQASALWVQTPDSLILDRVDGPDGRIVDPASITASAERGVRTVGMDASAVTAHGPGDYRFTYLQVTPITTNAMMAISLAVLLAAPALLAAVATREAVRHRRRAGTAWNGPRRNYVGGLVLLQAFYLAVLAWLLVARPFPLLVSWPMQPEAALLAATMMFFCLAFYRLAFVWKHQIVRAVEDELSAKNAALKELDRSNRDLEQFAYVASHDLQEPLRAVASYTQLLQRRYSDKLDKDANQYIAHAVEGASRMQGLINDLLAYSRVGSQAQPLRPTSLKSALDTATKNLHTALNESGAKVTHDALPEVLGDPVQLAQLLQNLIGNAIKFRSTARKCRIHVGARPTKDGWVVSVRDNGIGIEPGHFERIFLIFQRLHSRAEYPGSGIGLAICKRILERHGGRIWVESEPGKGSTFRFTLQSPPAEPSAPAPSAAANALASARRKWTAPKPV